MIYVVCNKHLKNHDEVTRWRRELHYPWSSSDVNVNARGVVVGVTFIYQL